MTRWLMITLMILIGVQTPVGAQDWPAPVEVHMGTGEAVYFYDCWPMANTTEGLPEDPTMLVYVTYADNLLIGYACNYSDGAWFPPFVQPGLKHAQNIYQ